MVEVMKPDTVDHAVHAVQWALAQECPLELYGGGTKRKLGRPFQAEMVLDLSSLAGIGLYEPEELVMSAAPGTLVSEIEAALAECGQRLAFEPPDLGPLFGGPIDRGTIGGVFSCNLSGPARIKAGAARDHLLGLHAINGRGEAFKTGGRVVKNVTGYDLSKLITGSYGTLAALTDLTFKVLPAPQATQTLFIKGLDFAQAVAGLTTALNSPHEVSGAAYLPVGLPTAKSGGGSMMMVRLEGVAPSVEARAEALSVLIGGIGKVGSVSGDEAIAQWQAVRHISPLTGEDLDFDKTAIWRVSVEPQQAPVLMNQIEALAWYADWGGGLIWLALPAEGDAGAARLRSVLADTGGHATLVRAPEAVRAAQAVFQPQAVPLALLSKRVKDSFDPKGILNPGRMYPGI